MLASEGRVIDRRAVCREKIHIESSPRHVFGAKRNAYNRLVSRAPVFETY